jgi:hypothetical protein
MMLDEEPENLAREIGHDGMEPWWPNLPSPHCFRGVSMQEIQGICFGRGFGLVYIEAFPFVAPLIAPTEEQAVYDEGKAGERFLKIIHGRTGMMIGEGSSGVHHAVAWDGEKCYDPNGRMYPLNNFSVRSAWLLIAMA